MDGLHAADGWPLAGRPVEGLAGLDQGLHGLADLEHRSGVVIPVAEQHIDVVVLQPLQRSVDAFDELLAGSLTTLCAFTLPSCLPQKSFVVST